MQSTSGQANLQKNGFMHTWNDTFFLAPKRPCCGFSTTYKVVRGTVVGSVVRTLNCIVTDAAVRVRTSCKLAEKSKQGVKRMYPCMSPGTALKARLRLTQLQL